MRMNEKLGQLGGRLWTATYGGSLRKNPNYRHDSELLLAYMAAQKSKEETNTNDLPIRIC